MSNSPDDRHLTPDQRRREIATILARGTGTHWNGFHSFRIGPKGAANGRETL